MGKRIFLLFRWGASQEGVVFTAPLFQSLRASKSIRSPAPPWPRPPDGVWGTAVAAGAVTHFATVQMGLETVAREVRSVCRGMAFGKDR